MDSLEWIPWGRPRTSPRGVETAYHHPLIAIRLKGDAAVRVVNPGDLASGSVDLNIESWRPMAWAGGGRRGWPALGALSPHTMFHGADGHLFHTVNSVCEQLFEGDPLESEGAMQWRHLLTRRVEWCRDHNMTYRHLVVPEHHSIYSDMIPDRPPLSEKRPLLQIANGLAPDVRETLIYPLEEMIAGRAKFDTSLRHDVHFTGYGCFLCYQALVKTLGSIAESQRIREEDLVESEIFVAGDVARAAGEAGQKVKFHRPPQTNYRAIIKGASFKANQIDVYSSDSYSDQTLVLFRTSNSTHLIPYLLRHFCRITAVATITLFYDLLLSEKPDVVIAEMPERYFGMKRYFSDSSEYTAISDDDLDFEAKTGYALPLPTT